MKETYERLEKEGRIGAMENVSVDSRRQMLAPRENYRSEYPKLVVVGHNGGRTIKKRVMNMHEELMLKTVASEAPSEQDLQNAKMAQLVASLKADNAALQLRIAQIDADNNPRGQIRSNVPVGQFSTPAREPANTKTSPTVAVEDPTRGGTIVDKAISDPSVKSAINPDPLGLDQILTPQQRAANEVDKFKKTVSVDDSISDKTKHQTTQNMNERSPPMPNKAVGDNKADVTNTSPQSNVNK